MMIDPSSPLITWAAGGGAFLVALKVLWPLVKQFVETQTTQGRTESGLLNQVMSERNSAIARADLERISRVEAEARADEYFEKMVQVSADLRVMNSQLKAQEQQLDSYRLQIEKMSNEITELTRLVQELRSGGFNAPNV